METAAAITANRTDSALQVVYLIDFKRSLATVAFSLLLLYIAFVLPLQIVFELLMLKIS